LVHEVADDAWKAAVARGERTGPAGTAAAPDVFADALAALVATEKERLAQRLFDRGDDGGEPERDLGVRLDAVAFELAELRGRIESLQASVDALAARSEG
jgi:hypothetical protein